LEVKCLFLVTLGFCSASALAGETGQLRLYRWNPGMKAENVPALESNIPSADYRQWLTAPSAIARKYPEQVFDGCYLAAWAPAPAGREPASANPPVKTEMHKICFSR
jgi:hypothetical protein